MERHQLKLGPVLEKELRDCDELWVAVALASDAGYQFIQQHVNPAAAQHWVVGLDLPTSPKVLRELMNPAAAGIQGRYYHKPGKTFHPKVYVLRHEGRYVAYVGSGNCTHGGLHENYEMALRTEDQEQCEKLRNTITTWFNRGKAVDDDFLAAYEKVFLKQEVNRKEDRQELQELLATESDDIQWDRIDFSDQFFKKEHFQAFSGRKPWLETPQANRERYAVRDRLLELNDLLAPEILKKRWDIHPHYVDEHIVSHAKHGQYVSKKLDSIWLHYGRSQSVLKSYGEGSTPLDFMRLQVIILEKAVGLWIRISKDNGSPFDRQHIKDSLTNLQGYAATLFALISALPDDYYIALNNGSKKVREFTSSEELKEYLLQADNKYYFIIGMELKPGDPRLSEDRIVDTVLKEFEVMYPIYDLLLHKISGQKFQTVRI